MGDFFSSFTGKEITFGAIAAAAIILILFGRLIPLRTMSTMVKLWEQRYEAERKAKEDWQRTATEAMMQNTLLLRKDDVATAALTSIHEMVQRHEGEEEA